MSGGVEGSYRLNVFQKSAVSLLLCTAIFSWWNDCSFVHAKKTGKAHAKTKKEKVLEEVDKLYTLGLDAESGNRDKALYLHKQACDLVAAQFGRESPEMVWPEFLFARCLLEGRRAKDAVPYFDHVAALSKKFPNARNAAAKQLVVYTYKCYLKAGEVEKARTYVAPWVKEFEKTDAYLSLQDLASHSAKNQNFVDSVKMHDLAIKACQKKGGDVLPMLNVKIMDLLRGRQYALVLPDIERKKEILKERNDPTRYADTVRELAKVNEMAERNEKAIQYYKEAVVLFKRQKRDRYAISDLMRDYARALRRANRAHEAESLDKEAYELKHNQEK